MSDDGRGGPGHVDERLLDHIPVHQQVAAGGQNQSIEDVRNHKDGIQHDGHAEENWLIDLKDLRDSISGVNIDEELADIIKFQHGYNAAAKFISVQDSLLDTVINRLGI